MKNPIHREMIDAFHVWYITEKGFKFIWDAKHNRQIDVIYEKLIQVCEQSNTQIDDFTILQLFEKILKNMQKADKWVYDNVSPALISSKFNELVAKIRGLGTGKGSYNSMKVDLINKMMNK